MTWTQTGGQSDRSVLLSTEQGGEEWARLQGHCEPGRAHGGHGERMERPRVPGGARLCDGGSDRAPHPRACEDSRCGLGPGGGLQAGLQGDAATQSFPP